MAVPAVRGARVGIGGAHLMARGRPRKTGKRYPSGKIMPAERARTSHWQRELEMLRAGSVDSRLGSAIGILAVRGLITAQALDAAMRFADARAAADAALGLPPRHARAQDMNAVHGSSNEPETMESAARKAKAIAAYDSAEEAVGLGSRPLAALRWVVIYDRREDDHAQLLALFDGLGKLMAHYRITGTVRPQDREGIALAAQR